MTIAIALVAGTIALVLWTIFGYPMLLSRRATRARAERPVLPPLTDLPTVTAVIPVHNGARFVADKVASVLNSDYPATKLDIILLSDGSTDDTDAIASGLADGVRVRFERLPKGGKAMALTRGFELATGEVLLMTDVRQQLEPQCIRRLVASLADPRVGVASGKLRIRSGETSGEQSTGLYWRYETWVRESLSAADSVLGATGPIYVMRRQLARALPAGCILDDVWLPMQAVLEGHRSILVSDAVAWDYPTSLTSEFGRKVRTQAGLYQLFQLEPRVLSPASNRLFWSFVNLKLFRLWLPHMLIVILAGSFFLPAPWRMLMLGAQSLFYGAALLNRLLPDGSLVKRVTAPADAFLTLVWAAFCAQSIFFRDPATLWKTTEVRRLPAAGAPR